MKKTNVMRMLDAARIAYNAKEYRYDETDLSGLHVAEELSLAADTVFKTLVARGDKSGPLVFCIPVHKELNLKKAAAATQNKSVELLPVKDLPGLTGYMRGGCSPIGMKKKFPTYFDKSISNIEEVSISAGIRGCQIILAADKLVQFVGGYCCELTD